MRRRGWQRWGDGVGLALVGMALVALGGCSGAGDPAGGGGVVTALAVTPAATTGYHLLRSWGMPKPNLPSGVAMGIVWNAQNDHVYVVGGAPGLPRIIEFTTFGKLVKQWGTTGPAPGQFDNPSWLAIGPGGDSLYVADGGTVANTRIEKFTTRGAFVTQWGSLGSGAGQFDVIGGLATDPTGACVYAVDTDHDRIEKFTNTGTLLRMWGSKGTGPGQFNYPTGIAVDKSGNVYVADAENFRVQKFTANGAFLTSWGPFANTAVGVLEGVGVGSTGAIFVVDAGDSEIKKFTNVGVPLTLFNGGSFGLALDSKGEVFTTAGGRVYVFI